MNAHFELVPRVFFDERGAVHRELADVRGEGDRAVNHRAAAFGGLDDLERGFVEHRMVKGRQTDADARLGEFFLGGCWFCLRGRGRSMLRPYSGFFDYLLLLGSSFRDWRFLGGRLFDRWLLGCGDHGIREGKSRGDVARGVEAQNFAPLQGGKCLLDDLRDHAGADRAAAFADGETGADVQGNRLAKRDDELEVVTRHDHFDVRGELNGSRDVGRAHVELGLVALEERRVAATFLFGEDVHLGLEFGVGLDGTGLCEHLTAFDVVALNAAEQNTDVVAGLTLVEKLVEHFDAGADGLLGLAQTDDFDFFVDLHDARLNAAGGDRASSLDGEDVFDRHQERLVEFTLGLGDVGIESGEEFAELGDLILVAFDGLESRTADDRGLVAGVVVLGEQFADLGLDQVDELGILDHVDLVEEDHDVRHVHLASEQDVLAGLRHGTVGCGYDKNSSIHLGGARDHVLDVVGVARAVDVRVVALGGLVLNVCGVDRNTALALLGGIIDVGVAFLLPFGREVHGESGRKGRLSVVDVTDGTDVDVRL